MLAEVRYLAFNPEVLPSVQHDGLSVHWIPRTIRRFLYQLIKVLGLGAVQVAQWERPHYMVDLCTLLYYNAVALLLEGLSLSLVQTTDPPLYPSHYYHSTSP